MSENSDHHDLHDGFDIPPIPSAHHIITIVLMADGSVRGDVDDVALWPIGTESTAESTAIDGQARSILDQALRRILSDTLSGRST